MPTRRWLVKTDPRLFSFADLEASRRTVWNGTRNPVALRHLRGMRPGEAVLVYHSGTERAVVGLARVVAEPRPDPEDRDGKGWLVDLAPGERLARPVTRRELRDVEALGGWELLTQPRLTVLPVPARAWRVVLARARSRPG